MRDLICIKTYMNRHEADFAQQILRDHELDSHVSSDDGGGMTPHLGFRVGYRLFVHAENAETALEILGGEST